MQPIQENAEPLPGYRLVSRLGRGGCGEVWKAVAPGGLPKAIKFVPGDRDGPAPGLAGQEYRSLHRVKEVRHPFVLSIERFDVVAGRLVIVMELADKNLLDRFDECQAAGHPGIPRAELLRYLEEAAEALDVMAAEHHLQHLDVKPQNIFLVHNHVKVGDFGLAKDLHGARAAGHGRMTPTYAAPELFDGWVSRQTDQYGLAILFQEMLTGTRPFDGAGAAELAARHRTAAPDLTALPPADRPAVARALAKGPDDRFPSCTEFVRALRQASGTPASPAVVGRTPVVNVPTSTRPPSPLPVVGRRTPVRLPAVPTGMAPRLTGPDRAGEEVLFPALVIGVGGTGLAALRQFRRLVHDRYGRATLPHLRWLLLDTDAGALADTLGGPQEAGFDADEVILVPPRVPADYKNRPGLPSFDTRLTEDTVTQLPAVPTTHGLRGFGRLALADHYPAVRERVRTALAAFTNLDPLAEAGRATGLGVRSGAPRVYLVASVAGGTGSGMLIDLAYLVRSQLRELRLSSDHVVGLLALPTVEEPTAAANASRALAELRHHGRPGTRYEAGFVPDAAPVIDGGRPFRRYALLPGATAPAVAAHLMALEALTPVGRAAHPDRAAAPENPCAAVGLRRVVWPRDRLIGAVARRLARETVVGWAAGGDPAAAAAAVDREWEDGRLDPAPFRAALESGVVQHLGRPVAALVREILAAPASGPAGAAVGAALDRLIEAFGLPAGPDEPDGAGRVAGALNERAADLARDAGDRLTSLVVSQLETPGARVAGAREALRLVHGRLTVGRADFDREATAAADESRAAFEALRGLVDAGAAADFPARAADWAEARCRHLRDRAAAEAHARVLRTLTQVDHELVQVASGLTALAREVSPPEAVPPADAVCEYLFPPGAGSWAEAIDRLAAGFGDRARRDFDDLIQSKLRAAGRGIIQVAVRPDESVPRLARVLRAEAEWFVPDLSDRLSAAQKLVKRFPDRADLEAHLRRLVESAAPDAGSLPVTVVGVPDDPAGRLVADLVRKLAGGGLVAEARTADEIVIWREGRAVSLDPLVERLAAIRPTAVTVLPTAEATSPSAFS